VILVAYIINGNCIRCGACEPQCPVDAISAGEDRYVINEDLCISCGACAAVCPVNAPKDEDQVD
jgi:ferredoxin